MDVANILTAIDAEISRLQQARAALTSIGAPAKPRPGRPKSTSQKPTRKKRTLGPEARARIAAAQKKRWAESKKAK